MTKEMSALRLTSSSSDVALEFSGVEGDYFRVAVVGRDHSATRRVYAHTDGKGVARLLSEAADEWRGWRGCKSWESLEGELRLELTADRLGHVTLAVRIRSDPGRADPWQLHAELSLDSGQLERIAGEAERLWRAEAT
jgi:hypothetical protein